jgi:hypothetical protein
MGRKPRAVHYQTGTRHNATWWARNGEPVFACGTDMLAIPRITAIPAEVTCGACRRTRAWRDAYRTIRKEESA